MTQAAEADSWPLNAILSSCPTEWPLDRRRVREIVGEVAAEVRSEIQAGIWHPPSTLCISPRLHGSRDCEEDGRRPELCRRGQRSAVSSGRRAGRSGGGPAKPE